MIFIKIQSALLILFLLIVLLSVLYISLEFHTEHICICMSVWPFAIQIPAVAIKCRNVNNMMIYVLLLFVKPVQAVEQILNTQILYRYFHVQRLRP